MKTYSSIHTLRAGLASYMKKKRLTQQDVAKATGVPQSAISLFLREKRGLNGESTLKLQTFILNNTALKGADA